MNCKLLNLPPCLRCIFVAQADPDQLKELDFICWILWWEDELKHWDLSSQRKVKAFFLANLDNFGNDATYYLYFKTAIDKFLPNHSHLLEQMALLK